MAIQIKESDIKDITKLAGLQLGALNQGKINIPQLKGFLERVAQLQEPPLKKPSKSERVRELINSMK
jgi:hypothetical protein